MKMARWKSDDSAPGSGSQGAGRQPPGEFHLEAPAGSGKTAVLLARFLTLLARGIGVTPGNPDPDLYPQGRGGIPGAGHAVFLEQKRPGRQSSPHEAAIHELASRAFWHLDQKNLVHQFLQVPERLPISTFHGFCTQLLKAAPHEAGVPLEFQLLEDDRAAEWQKQEALEELRRRLNLRPQHDPVRQALVRRLVRLNNNWPRLAGSCGISCPGGTP